MRNLKLQYEKVDDSYWQESLGREEKDKRIRKLRKGKIDHRYRLDKKSRRLRFTWE